METNKTHKKKELTATRHPTEQKDTFPSFSPSPISLGNTERKVLLALPKDTTDRFNIKNFARETGIPRTTITDVLMRLEKKGLAKKEGWGMYIITIQGLSVLKVTEGGVGSVRKEWREGDKISQHFTRFVLPISNKKDFNIKRIKEMNPDKLKTLTLPNNEHHYAYFNDATIIIFKNQIVIRIHDIVRGSAEETILDSFTKALGYLTQLEKIGLKSEQIKLERAHWATIGSSFAEFLKKINERYYLDLGEGKKLWIDHSTGPIEHEVNDLEIEQRLNAVLEDAINNSESYLSDIDKMKPLIGSITKLELLRTKQMGYYHSAFSKMFNLQMEEQKPIPKEQKSMTDYIG